MDGRLIDLVKIGERCRGVGAPLVVDLTQSAGAYPFDVKSVQPDFLVAAGYKWLLCPYSFSFLYVAPHRQDGAPIEIHANNRRDSDKGHVWENGVLRYREGWLPGARRFDVGERANFGLSPMAEAALRLIVEWEPQRIGASIKPITERIISAAEGLGYRAPRSDVRGGHFTGLRPPRPLPKDAQERLARAGVYLTVRGDFLRISPHIWVDDNDLDRLVGALDTLARSG
jgi:selenocysteine lyase/cysteine desulfurase